MRFVGREAELKQLNQLFKKKSASLVVIRGRRRIGKSRLISEFTKGKNSWLFSGLPPTERTTKQSQIDEFVKQMARNLKMPQLKTDNWGDVFWHLGQPARNGELVIVLDETSWMGSEDLEFLGHLKNAWDLYFSKNPDLILIMCGSVS
ncbi:MAG: ATP-binding protein, partial [Chlamydiales bacterium]